MGDKARETVFLNREVNLGVVCGFSFHYYRSRSVSHASSASSASGQILWKKTPMPSCCHKRPRSFPGRDHVNLIRHSNNGNGESYYHFLFLLIFLFYFFKMHIAIYRLENVWDRIRAGPVPRNQGRINLGSLGPLP